VALLAFCLLALIPSAGLAMVSSYQGITALLQGHAELATASLINAAGILARMLLILPTCYYALLRIMDRPARHLPLSAIPSWVLVLVWFGCLGLGALLVGDGGAAALLLPILSVAAAIIPVWLILRAALRELAYGSDLRRWGTFTVGSTVGPWLSTVLEALAVLAIILVALVYLFTNPGLVAVIQNLALRLREATTEQAAIQVLLPFMLRPSVIAIVILGVCVLTPLIEEAAKPIGVWLGAGQISTPAQGFALGALCGAGFALYENFSAMAVGGTDWELVTILRVGTAIMHIANSALMGWGLVGAWRGRHFLRLGFIYALVVTVHGLWNLLALSYGLSSLPPLLEGTPLNLPFGAPFALPVLGLLAAAMLIVLLIMNRHLQEPPYGDISMQPLDGSGDDLRV
jgi:hypothetical protein